MIKKTIALLLVSCVVASAQLPKLTQRSFTNQNRIRSIALLGDVNGDGHGDYAYIGIYLDGFPVTVLSGLDSSIIYTVPDSGILGTYGEVLNAIGDVDGDGVTDFIVTGWQTPTYAVASFSGATGAPLTSALSVPGWPLFGTQNVSVGDVDGDNVPDVAVTWHGDVSVQLSGYVLYSGANGNLIRGVTLNSSSMKIAAAGDVNNDGLGDVAVVHDVMNVNGFLERRAAVLSGLNDAVLHDIPSAAGLDRARGISGLSDVDGDGFGDFAVGFTSVPGIPEAGRVVAYSGQTGLPLWTVSSPTSLLGKEIYHSADVNGDGTQDVVALDEEPLSLTNSVNVKTFSGVDGAMISDYQIHQGPYVSLDVDAGVDMNGDGFEDMACAIRDFAGARMSVFTGTGSRIYGKLAHPLQTLDLDWLQGPSGDHQRGKVVVSGAQPNSMGLGFATLAKSNYSVSGLPVLVDANPLNLVTQGSFMFNLAGQNIIDVDLQNPFMAGTTIFVQQFALSSPLACSNGLQLLFSN